MVDAHHRLDVRGLDGAIWRVYSFDESNSRALLPDSGVLVLVETVLVGRHRVGEVDQVLCVQTTPRTRVTSLRHGW